MTFWNELIWEPVKFGHLTQLLLDYWHILHTTVPFKPLHADDICKILRFYSWVKISFWSLIQMIWHAAWLMDVTPNRRNVWWSGNVVYCLMLQTSHWNTLWKARQTTMWCDVVMGVGRCWNVATPQRNRSRLGLAGTWIWPAEDILSMALSQNINWVVIHKNTLYLALTAELWDVFCRDSGEKWPCYNGTTLYLRMSSSRVYQEHFKNMHELLNLKELLKFQCC